MEQIINQKIKNFIQAIGKKELRLYKIRNAMGMKIGLKEGVYMNQLRILTLKHFLIEYRKEGRNCFIKLTKTGLFYLKLFNDVDKLRKS